MAYIEWTGVPRKEGEKKEAEQGDSLARRLNDAIINLDYWMGRAEKLGQSNEQLKVRVEQLEKELQSAKAPVKFVLDRLTQPSEHTKPEANENPTPIARSCPSCGNTDIKSYQGLSYSKQYDYCAKCGNKVP